MSNDIANATRKSLRERATEFDTLLPFMEGREKGDGKELLAQVSTITDYGFLTNEDGEPYAAFIVKERPGKFYFAGMVLTERLTTLEEEGYHEDVQREGLPVLLTETKARKGGRTYTNVVFFPEV